MQDLNKFIEHSNDLLGTYVSDSNTKHVNFTVPWNNASYEVHYVYKPKNERAEWEMMAYVRLN
jgi:hypothetical protein